MQPALRYLLDTNAVIAVLNDPKGRVAQRLRTHRPEEVAVSVVVLFELYYGAFKSARRANNLALVDGLRFEVLPFEHEDARHAGEIRAELSTRGSPIGAYDVMIAGQARARGLVLVTRNLSEFQRVSGLACENWHG
ncbi:MAG: type II toxin-antitoxin system VapC family toxin [Thiobacillaceae bacterium]|nr:type II toxin-antitoxin system VapC family toxin [Thiobacillaceae bacterium]